MHGIKWTLIVAMWVVCLAASAQQLLVDRGSKITFFSSAPLEDITATTEEAASALNPTNGEVAFKVPIKSFKFRKRLMQEHFNERYLESHQYPFARFSGKITDTVDWDREGKREVTVVGNLTIHGVKKYYTTKAAIDVKGRAITAHAKFDVRIADHRIKIPRIVIKNIAEVVEVTISSTYQKQ